MYACRDSVTAKMCFIEVLKELFRFLCLFTVSTTLSDTAHLILKELFRFLCLLTGSVSQFGVHYVGLGSAWVVL